MERTDLKSMTRDQRSQCLKDMGLPAFRVTQIGKWLDKGAADFDEMTDLSLELREELKKKFTIPKVKIKKRLVSALDDTVKYLYSLPDGETVESVLMNYKHGWSQCLSTQVGCRMGCAFCATGMGGWVRNLTPAEMIAQIEAAQVDRGVRVSSLVLMGMGEPLDNLDNVLRFLRMLGESETVRIGMRHVSLSTCGLVDGIRRLMAEGLQLTLSVSLHAPNDAIRTRLMPVARRWPVEELIDACREYAETTGRRISFEYAMADGVNDTDACAGELADLLKGMLCHVNLIPVNPVEGSPYRSSSRARLQAFASRLEKKGIPVTVRRKLGADIQAACGQLRRQGT